MQRLYLVKFVAYVDDFNETDPSVYELIKLTCMLTLSMSYIIIGFINISSFGKNRYIIVAIWATEVKVPSFVLFVYFYCK